MRRSKITCAKQPAVTISRFLFSQQKIVYLLVANKPFRYPLKKSRIIYIGTSKTGASRIGQSVVARGENALGKFGITQIEAHVVMSRPRKKVQIWKKLESALVIAFRREYGEVPRYNSQLSKKVITNEFDYFKKSRLVEILSHYDNKVQKRNLRNMVS